MFGYRGAAEGIAQIRECPPGTTRQLPTPAMAPQVGGQLFGVHLPIENQIFKISYFHKFY